MDIKLDASDIDYFLENGEGLDALFDGLDKMLGDEMRGKSDGPQEVRVTIIVNNDIVVEEESEDEESNDESTTETPKE